MIRDLDIWSQVGYGQVYKRVLDYHNTGNRIKISFPRVKSGQAIIAAIAIRQGKKDLYRVNCGGDDYVDAEGNLWMQDHCRQDGMSGKASATMWADFDKDILTKTPDELLPPKTSRAIEVEPQKADQTVKYEFSVGVAKVYTLRFKYWNGEKARKLHVRLTDSNGVVYKDDDITFLQTQQKATKRKMTSITTGDFVNAGTYTVTISGEGLAEMVFDNLFVE